MKDKPVLPPTYLLLAIVMMLALHLLFPMAIAITTPWNIVGIIPLAIGLILNLVAERTSGMSGAGI